MAIMAHQFPGGPAQIPRPTKLYHITAIENLQSILARQYILSYSKLSQEETAHTNIAYNHIQDRRAKKRVPCGPGGVLHDYVPFYFAPRSPMLHAIWKGKVPDYPRGQSSVIYLVSSVEVVQEAGLEFVFTDGHGTMDFSGYFDDPTRLDCIDWRLMNDKLWRNTEDDNDRSRRRQAEFLVHQRFPLELLLGIAVIDATLKAEVKSLLADAGREIEVRVVRQYYY